MSSAINSRQGSRECRRYRSVRSGWGRQSKFRPKVKDSLCSCQLTNWGHRWSGFPSSFFFVVSFCTDLRCTMHLFVGISSVVRAAQRKLQFGQMYFPRPIFSRRFVFLTSRYREYLRGHFDCLQRCAIPKGQSSQRLVVVNIARAETPSPHRHFIRYKRIPVLPRTYVSPF